MNETNIQQSIRLALSKTATKIFRNNQGGYKDQTGRWVTYGVCNPGGSDLIGWTSITITPEMVGKKIAVFTAIEVKSATGKIRPEQQNFIDRVRLDGGMAGVARSTDDAIQITQPYEYQN
jgi:hypothetical protein